MKNLQQEEVEVNTARCHPSWWFGGGRNLEAAGGGKDERLVENTDEKRDIVENGVMSGDLRLEEGILKRTLDLEQHGDTKAAKLDDVNHSDLADGSSHRRGLGSGHMEMSNVRS